MCEGCDDDDGRSVEWGWCGSECGRGAVGGRAGCGVNDVNPFTACKLALRNRVLGTSGESGELGPDCGDWWPNGGSAGLASPAFPKKSCGREDTNFMTSLPYSGSCNLRLPSGTISPKSCAKRSLPLVQNELSKNLWRFAKGRCPPCYYFFGNFHHWDIAGQHPRG